MAPLTTSIIFVYFRGLSLRLTRISRQRVIKLSLVLVFASIPVFLTGFVFFFLAESLEPFGYLKLIFSVLKSTYRLAFASISIVFSITSFYKSKLCPQFFNQVYINRRNLLQK